jgi:hypothetical protein
MSTVDISEGHAEKLFYNQLNKSVLLSCSNPNVIVEYDCATFQELKTYLHNDLGDIVDVTGTNDYIFACSGDKIFQWSTTTGEFITIRKSITDVAREKITKLFINGQILYAGLVSGHVFSWNIYPPFDSPPDVYFFRKGVDDIYADNDFIYAICNKSYMLSMYKENYEVYFEKKINNGRLRFVADPYKRNNNVLFIVGNNRLFPYSTYKQSLIEPIDWNIQANHCITIDKNHMIYSNKLNTQIDSIIIDQDTTYHHYATTNQFLHFTHCGRSLYILHKTHIEKVHFKTANTHEEDSDEFESLSSASDSITLESESDNLSSCTNDNLITLEPYNKDDDPIFMYIPNSKMKFEKAVCSTKDELTSYYNSMKGTSIPDNIMAIFTSPDDSDVSGYGGEPTGKIIVKLPVNNIYVTMGSMKRMLSDTANKTWYLLPLFGGKRRRVGNIKGIFGASMNHGQIPGFIIFKAFTKDEIKKGVKVEETASDYPAFLLEHARSLFILVGGEEGLTPTFIDGLIHEIVT